MIREREEWKGYRGRQTENVSELLFLRCHFRNLGDFSADYSLQSLIFAKMPREEAQSMLEAAASVKSAATATSTSSKKGSPKKKRTSGA